MVFLKTRARSGNAILCLSLGFRRARQFSWQRIGPLRDRAGAEANDVIARRGDAGDERRQLLGTVERDHLAMAMRAQALHQSIAVGALDRSLAGRINMRDDHDIGVVEAGAELIEQSL